MKLHVADHLLFYSHTSPFNSVRHANSPSNLAGCQRTPAFRNSGTRKWFFAQYANPGTYCEAWLNSLQHLASYLCPIRARSPGRCDIKKAVCLAWKQKVKSADGFRHHHRAGWRYSTSTGCVSPPNVKCGVQTSHYIDHRKEIKPFEQAFNTRCSFPLAQGENATAHDQLFRPWISCCDKVQYTATDPKHGSFHVDWQTKI